MEYFEILNLTREPFSNSPDPELFYGSRQHAACLQKLELSVRLRRGLNVVIGDVGTGKTTLCRQLILKFNVHNGDGARIATHLVMDPSFDSAVEFLTTVAKIFGIPHEDKSEWQLKEAIKNYLFTKGVEENKTVVLIIDEGQKLHDFCLEILREFLNYETNNCKLLQIIIFAQKEFEHAIKKRANFADRINQYYLLRPLNFKETCGMIKFRIGMASGNGAAPAIFTRAGLWAVYRTTGGYPRKIITLCHHTLLALIIQNKARAGWSAVRSCSQRVSPERPGIIRWAAAGSTLALVAGFIAVTVWTGSANVSTMNPQKNEPAENSIKKQPSAAQKQEPVKDSGPVADTRKETMPELLGQLKIAKDENVWLKLVEIYGRPSLTHLDAVIKANPRINDINIVRVGEVIDFPALSAPRNPAPSGKYFIQIASGDDLEQTYRLLSDYRKTIPDIRLLPYWNSREKMKFAILLTQNFKNEASVRDAIKQLPPPVGSQAVVLNKWDDDTVFFGY